MFSAQIAGLAAGGAGLARYEGTCVFIEDTCPGDVVVGRIREEHRGWARADTLEITSASPARVQPVCALYGECGGCSLQHIAYETQLAEKQRILTDAFTHIGNCTNMPELGVHASAPFEYRNRVQIHQQTGQGSGFKARRSNAVIAVTDCPIADPGIRQALREKCLTPPPEKDRFTVYARKTEQSEVFLCEGGQSRGLVPVLDRELLMDAGVFFQSNAIMLEALLQDLLAISKTADADLPAADLYCGVGTFAAFLRDRFPRMDLVEQNKTALSLARENIARGAPSVRGVSCAARMSPAFQYFALAADDWVKSTASARGRASTRSHDSARYGFVVLDPPRQGLSPLVRKRLATAKIPVLAYVSCDPATLARDSRAFIAAGYRLSSLTLYDFYPQTAHIETLAVFNG
jgi:23S rRNA (uracil1939-C5)-methyltransferase